MPISHSFVSTKSDSGDTTLVRPSNWNADHVEETWEQVMSTFSSGLVHRWKFEDASGNFADSVGSLTLTASGTINYQQSSPLGYGARFQASGSAIGSGMGSLPLTSAARTSIAVFKTNANISTAAVIHSYGSTGSTRQWWAYKLNDASAFSDSAVVWADDSQWSNRGGSDGSWHMSVVGCDGSQALYFFFDGDIFVRRLGGTLNTGSGTSQKVNTDGIDVYFSDLAVWNVWLGKGKLDRFWKALSLVL